jgi:hypothetical protein
MRWQGPASPRVARSDPNPERVLSPVAWVATSPRGPSRAFRPTSVAAWPDARPWRRMGCAAEASGCGWVWGRRSGPCGWQVDSRGPNDRRRGNRPARRSAWSRSPGKDASGRVRGLARGSAPSQAGATAGGVSRSRWGCSRRICRWKLDGRSRRFPERGRGPGGVGDEVER